MATETELIETMFHDSHVARTFLKAQEVLARPRATIYYKWTCGGCGERAVCDDANSLYTSFIHEDCGYETPTVDGDLGFAVILKAG